MRVFLGTVLLCVLISSTDLWADAVEIVNGCPLRYVRNEMECMEINISPGSWVDADKKCKEEGSFLFFVKSRETYDEIFVAGSNVSNSAASNLDAMKDLMGNGVAVGLQFTVADNTWRWADGTVYKPGTDWALWDGAAPSQPTKDACTVLKKKGKDFKWFLVDCSLSLGVSICQNTATTPVSNCPPNFFQAKIFCLSMVLKPYISAIEGAKSCAENGNSYLPTMKSRDDYNQMLSEGQAQLSSLPLGIWIGLRYSVTDKAWKWSDGSTLQTNDWTLWKDGTAPDSSAYTTEMCVTAEKTDDNTLAWTTQTCDAEVGLALCMVQSADAAEILANPSALKGDDAGGSSGGGSGGGGGSSHSGGDARFCVNLANIFGFICMFFVLRI